MSAPRNWTLAILPAIDADGPTQMGLDLALLDHAHDEPATIWWRTYTWSRPTLSLGYFQAWNDASAEIRNLWSGYDVVRRPSGGGAIVHHGDLTYSIVVPAEHPWCGQPRTLYQAVHDAIATMLAEDGADAARRQAVDPRFSTNAPSVTLGTGSSLRAAATRAPSPFLCFEDGDADDLVLDGVKIVGGAQRRRGWATLQHGSIRWKSPGTGPGSAQPGLVDLRPDFRTPNSLNWASGIGERLARFWDIPHRKSGIPAEVMLAGHAWSRRLRDREWLEKR